MLKSKTLLLVVLAACFFASCKSDPAYDKAAQLAIDEDIINKQLEANGETASKTATGLYYQVLDPGTGATAALTDTVQVHYVGRLFQKQTLFDSTATNIDKDATKFLLKDVIVGWQQGIPLIKAGGRIRLILPSTLAYENRQVSTVVLANSILDFDVRLIKVITPTTK